MFLKKRLPKQPTDYNGCNKVYKNQKKDLFKDYQIGAVSETYYKEYRNALNSLIKNAKKSHYMAIFTNYKNDIRRIWNAINQLKNNHKISTLNRINVNNKVITNPSEIAESFNEYFVNIAHKLDDQIPPSTISPCAFLQGDYPSSMMVPFTIPQDVASVIKQMKNKKGNTHEIPVSLMKANNEEISIPLSMLFNQSVENSVFPNCLKHATVIPHIQTWRKG